MKRERESETIIFRLREIIESRHIESLLLQKKKKKRGMIEKDIFGRGTIKK